ncbi:MAG: LamG domain-containing protein [Alphaproteobacteria bacterium]|nr:LamG domain-containing protein [Alphaproteobacteria bacterium]
MMRPLTGLLIPLALLAACGDKDTSDDSSADDTATDTAADDTATDDTSSDDTSSDDTGSTNADLCGAMLVEWDSSQALVEAAPDLNFEGGDSFTVTGWFHFNGPGGHVMVKGDNNTKEYSIGYSRNLDGQGPKLCFNRQDVGRLVCGDYPDNHWFHATLVYDAGELSYYLNGEQNATGSGSLGTGYDTDLTLFNYPSELGGMRGALADMAIIGKELTADEAMSLATLSATPGDFAEVVAWWDADRADADDLTLSDVSGNGHDAPLRDDHPQLGSCVMKDCGALSMGPGGVVEVPADPGLNLDPSSPFTISFSALIDDDAGRVLRKGDRDSSEWEIVYYDGHVRIGRPGVSETVTINAIWPDRWQRYTATWDGTTWTLYNSVTGLPYDTSTALSIGAASDTPLYIGDAAIAGGDPASGVLDDFAIWDRQLSDDEVLALTNGDILPEDVSGLIALWDFNEASGTTVSDRSGNGHTGTVYGTTLVDACAP